MRFKNVKKKAIDSQVVDKFINDKYTVKTIIPLVDDPVKKTYVLNQEELNELLEGYNEYGEFIISVKPKG
ncbi:MAG: hypothetical protein K9K76_09175 [Halanaerobiales bacterium]|nr:hypothetical protein [Halanaerobiales bacterium]